MNFKIWLPINKCYLLTCYIVPDIYPLDTLKKVEFKKKTIQHNMVQRKCKTYEKNPNSRENVCCFSSCPDAYLPNTSSQYVLTKV